MSRRSPAAFALLALTFERLVAAWVRRLPADPPEAVRPRFRRADWIAAAVGAALAVAGVGLAIAVLARG